MKIVWLAHEGNVSGANIALLEYVHVLKDDYDFHIILPHAGSMEEELRSFDIPYSIIHQYGWTGSFSLFTIMKCLKVWGRSAYAITQTVLLLKKTQASFFFTNTITTFSGSIASYLLKIPHVWWIHEFGEEDFGFSIGLGNKKTAFNWIQKSSKLIVCNSEAVKQKYSTLMPLAHIIRLYQPVTFNLPAPAPVQLHKATYLMFGQIIPSKGHIEVLKAFLLAKEIDGDHRRLSLHIKGPSENAAYLNHIKQFIEEHGLKDFMKVDTGFFKKEDVIPFYKVLIVASDSEAFGRVIVEAAKAGLKVIVKRSGGAPELLNESNGLLYDSIEELSDILAGRTLMPDGGNTAVYDESAEIKKLKTILAGLHDSR